MYRVAPHATTGVAPCMLFLGRDLKTRMHLLVSNQQANQKSQHDQRAKTREFVVGQEVMTRSLRPRPKYVTGVVIQKLGPLSYLVEVGEGLVWQRHVDHLKELASTTTGDKAKDKEVEPDPEEFFPTPPEQATETDVSTAQSGNDSTNSTRLPDQQTQRFNRRSHRTCHPPNWYGCVISH